MGDALQRHDVSITGVPARERVRTPGKHIVLFTLAVTFMIGVSTLMLSMSDIALSERPITGVGKPVEETFLTDLSPDAQGRLRLLKMTVAIETNDAQAKRALEEKRAQVLERLSFFLRQLSPEDLDGSAAQTRLKSEMLKRINLSLSPQQADDVTIKSIIIQ